VKVDESGPYSDFGQYGKKIVDQARVELGDPVHALQPAP
jgi:hypothetical protein